MRKLSAFNLARDRLGIAFLYLPIVILVIFSFNASRLVAVWGGWSTRWYAELLNDVPLLDSAFISLRIALVAATRRRSWARWRRWRWCASAAFAAGSCSPP
jgi:putrescine transport system permease protein